MTSLMTSRTRVLPLPSEPTHSPWSGGSRLNWFPPADEPNRWSKWLRPAKLVMRFGFEVVTCFGWVMAPTGVPPELALRSGPSEPSLGPATSKLSIPPGWLDDAGRNEAVPELVISRVVPLPSEPLTPLVAAIALLAPAAATAVPATRMPAAAIATRACQSRRRLDIALPSNGTYVGQELPSVLCDTDDPVKGQTRGNVHFAC